MSQKNKHVCETEKKFAYIYMNKEGIYPNNNENTSNCLEKAHISYIKKEWSLAINYIIQAYEMDGIWNKNKCDLLKQIAYYWIKHEMSIYKKLLCFCNKTDYTDIPREKIENELNACSTKISVACIRLIEIIKDIINQKQHIINNKYKNADKTELLYWILLLGDQYKYCADVQNGEIKLANLQNAEQYYEQGFAVVTRNNLPTDIIYLQVALKYSKFLYNYSQEKYVAITFLQTIFDRIVKILISNEESCIDNYNELTNGLQMAKDYINMWTYNEKQHKH